MASAWSSRRDLTDQPTMTKAEMQEAAEVLWRVVERIDQGEVNAPAWYRERLVGAILALQPREIGRARPGVDPSRVASRP